MKRTIVILAVSITAAFGPRTVLAAADFDLGLKVGLSLAQIRFTGSEMLPMRASEDEGLSLLARPVFGAFFAYHISPMFSIQPEIYFLTQGTLRNQTIDATVLRTEQVLGYIHVPILAKARFMAGRSVRPVVFAGPAVSFLTKATQRFYVDGDPGDDYDLKPFLKGTNFSAVIGAGLEYSLKKTILVLDVRYDLGFVDIDTNSATVFMKTRALLIMAGIGF